MGFVIVCVVAAALLPYALLVASGWPSRSTLARWGPGWDNHDVRGSMDRLRGWRRRAHFAQLNGHEAFAPFAAALILAQLAAAPAFWCRALGVGFLVLRGLHAICYVADWAFLRSTFWCGASLCVLGLFAAAFLSVG
jgi:uncharacterized MAPEG superfamily protein